MNKIQLKAKLREGKGTSLVRKLRNEGFLPGVVYGHDFTNLHVAVSQKEFIKAISGEAGRNVLIEMHLEKNGSAQEVPVMVKDLQHDPLTSKVLHVDFLHILLKEKIKTKVRVEIQGNPLGVKEDGGILIHGLREVEVECLPTDIPNEFKVDVSELRIGNSIHVSGISPPADVSILTSPDETLASVAAPAKEEVEVPVVPADQVPVVGAGEALAEGEAAPAEGAKKGGEVVPEKKGPAPAKERKEEKK